MGLAQTARDRQRATIGGRANPFQNDDPLGKAFADWAVTTGEQALTGSVKAVGDWWERSSADQEGVGDDLLRLVAGGVKNTTKAWKDASAEQEGITDDILRGVGWTAGKGMQVLDAGSYYGGKLGGNIGRMVGIDPRITGALGNVGGDLLAGGIFLKAGKVVKTAKQIKRLNQAGYSTDVHRAVSIAQKKPYAFAYGPEGAVKTQATMTDALTLGNKTHEAINQLDNLARVEKVLTTDDIPTFVYRRGRKKAQQEANRELQGTVAKIFDENMGELREGLNRNTLFRVYDDAGNQRMVQGFHQYMDTKDPTKIKFIDKQSATKGNKARALRMKAPEKELRQLATEVFPDNPALQKELIEDYLSSYNRDFALVQEASRRQGLTLKQLEAERLSKTARKTKRFEKEIQQYQAGHWRATDTLEHPHLPRAGDSPLYDAPTGGWTARIENATENMSAGSKVDHDINPWAAKQIGIPRTWEEDFLYWVDRRMGWDNVPDWKELGGSYMEVVESIPYDASPEQVTKILDDLSASIKADPHHWTKQSVKDIRRDVDLPEGERWQPFDPNQDLVEGTGEDFVKRKTKDTSPTPSTSDILRILKQTKSK